MGTSQSWHGLADLVKAARILKQSGLGVKFLLVGPVSADVVKAAETELAGTLVLTGSVPYREVAEYINAADIAVAPYNILRSYRRTKGIGSPLKVLEYMACGKPVVGSDIRQVAEIIEDGKDGVLFPQGDVEGFAGKISKLAKNGQLREELGKNALEKARNGFSWYTFAVRLQEELIECIRGQPGRGSVTWT